MTEVVHDQQRPAGQQRVDAVSELLEHVLEPLGFSAMRGLEQNVPCFFEGECSRLLADALHVAGRRRGQVSPRQGIGRHGERKLQFEIS